MNLIEKVNDPMDLVILKFGGTSIKDRVGFEKASKHIAKAIKHGSKVVCVVSAMGRKDDPYATDTLKGFINYVTTKEQDRLISVGETISSVFFTDFLIEHGFRAISLSTKEIGIITDHTYTDANIVDFDGTIVKHYLGSHDVLVVPGFQGMTPDGYTTTLGRGGSDTTAIFLGIMLNAREIRIVSDVDGIYSGDPRVIKHAYRYPMINYSQLETITRNGSKVLHDKAASLAKRHKANIIFCHIDDDSSFTKVTDEVVPLFNVTAKHNYYRFTMKGIVITDIAERYLGDYYIPVTESEPFEEKLKELEIEYEKELGFTKISVLIDRGKLQSKCAYVKNEQYIDCLNMVHDMYLYRG